MTFVQAQRPKIRYRTRVAIALYFVAEVGAFIGVAVALNTLTAILITIATTCIGSVLLRILGIKALREYRNSMLAHEPPGTAVVSGAIGVIGSIMLMLPGFVSDVAGLLFVLPPSRKLVRPAFSKLLAKRAETILRANVFNRPHTSSRASSTDDEVIDGEVVNGEPDGRGEEPPHENGPRSLP